MDQPPVACPVMPSFYATTPIYYVNAAPPPAAGTTTGLPWPAWVALGLLTAGAAGGAATTGRRRRDARARTHAAHRYR